MRVRGVVAIVAIPFNKKRNIGIRAIEIKNFFQKGWQPVQEVWR